MFAAKWLLGHGTGTGGHVDAESHGVRRHDDVTEEHCGIDPVPPYRLQRDLCRELGVANRVEDAAGAANCAVLGQASAGLAHEPHRSVGRWSAGGSGEEGHVR